MSAALWLRVPFGLFLIAHGVAHFVGTASLWGVLEEENQIATPALSWLGEGAGAITTGSLFAIAGVAFIVVGVMILFGAGTVPVLTAVTVASLLICIAVIPAAPVGIVIDVVLLVCIGVWTVR